MPSLPGIAGVVLGCGVPVAPGAGVVLGCGVPVAPGAGVVLGCGVPVDMSVTNGDDVAVIQETDIGVAVAATIC